MPQEIKGMKIMTDIMVGDENVYCNKCRSVHGRKGFCTKNKSVSLFSLQMEKVKSFRKSIKEAMDDEESRRFR